jgi:hypothetical protein
MSTGSREQAGLTHWNAEQPAARHSGRDPPVTVTVTGITITDASDSDVGRLGRRGRAQTNLTGPSLIFISD